MIPSFKSFPAQPPQQDSEVPASSSKHKSSKKDRKRSRERTRNGEPEKHRHKHKHKHRDHDSVAREDNRWEASSSSAFFSDHKGNRAAVHGGGADPIRVPKYNLVARTSAQNLIKYN